MNIWTVIQIYFLFYTLVLSNVQKLLRVMLSLLIQIQNENYYHFHPQLIE